MTLYSNDAENYNNWSKGQWPFKYIKNFLYIYYKVRTKADHVRSLTLYHVSISDQFVSEKGHNITESLEEKL